MAPAEPASEAAETFELQWKYVTYIYAAGCTACAGFAVCDRIFEVEAVKGFWLIFSLFPFMLVFGIYKTWLQSAAHASKKKAD